MKQKIYAAFLFLFMVLFSDPASVAHPMFSQQAAQAYLAVLEQNRNEIVNYSGVTHVIKPSEFSHPVASPPIAFANVIGDETPEMFILTYDFFDYDMAGSYTYDEDEQFIEHGDVAFHLYTFKDGEASPVALPDAPLSFSIAGWEESRYSEIHFCAHEQQAYLAVYGRDSRLLDATQACAFYQIGGEIPVLTRHAVYREEDTQEDTVIKFGDKAAVEEMMRQMRAESTVLLLQCGDAVDASELSTPASGAMTWEQARSLLGGEPSPAQHSTAIGTCTVIVETAAITSGGEDSMTVGSASLGDILPYYGVTAKHSMYVVELPDGTIGCLKAEDAALSGSIASADYTAIPTGTRRINVRTGQSTDHRVLREVKPGLRLPCFGLSTKGWRIVQLDDGLIGCIMPDYSSLSTKAP